MSFLIDYGFFCSIPYLCGLHKLLSVLVLHSAPLHYNIQIRCNLFIHFIVIGIWVVAKFGEIMNMLVPVFWYIYVCISFGY